MFALSSFSVILSFSIYILLASCMFASALSFGTSCIASRYNLGVLFSFVSSCVVLFGSLNVACFLYSLQLQSLLFFSLSHPFSRLEFDRVFLLQLFTSHSTSSLSLMFVLLCVSPFVFTLEAFIFLFFLLVSSPWKFSINTYQISHALFSFSAFRSTFSDPVSSYPRFCLSLQASLLYLQRAFPLKVQQH